MSSFARRWWLAGKVKRTAVRGGVNPSVESLEDRTVPSVSLPTAGTPGPVTLTGTSGNDQFIIRVQSGTTGTGTRVEFSDNGGSSFSSAALSDVKSITVNGLAGQDVLAIDVSNGLIASSGGLPIIFNAGSGTDTVALAGAAGTLNETYNAGNGRGAASILVSNGSVTQDLSFTGVEKVQDTMQAASLTVNLANRRNLVSFLNGPTVNGVATNRIQDADRLGLNFISHRDENGFSHDDDDEDDDDQGTGSGSGSGTGTGTVPPPPPGGNTNTGASIPTTQLRSNTPR